MRADLRAITAGVAVSLTPLLYYSSFECATCNNDDSQKHTPTISNYVHTNTPTHWSANTNCEQYAQHEWHSK